MADPTSQYPQLSSNPLVDYRKEPHDPTVQRNLSNATYQNGLGNYDSYGRPYAEPVPSQYGYHPEDMNGGPRQDERQWSGPNGPWPQRGHHTDTNVRGDGRREHYQPSSRQVGEYDQGNVQYGARRSPPGNASHQHLDFGRGDLSVQTSYQEQDYIPSSHGYRSVGRVTDYGGAGWPPPANGEQGPQGHDTRNRDVRQAGSRYDSAGPMSSNVIRQYQPSGMAREQREPHPDYHSSRYDGKPSEPTRHLRAPDAGNEHTRGAARERILTSPTSPDTVSWDNPFPTFPSSKKIGKQTGTGDLSRSMGDMSIDQIPLSRQSEEPRPSTNQGLLRHEFPYNGGPSRSQEDAAAKPVTRDARNPSEAQRLGGRAVQGVSGGPQPSHRSLKHPDHPLNGLRPQMEHGRRSEDTARDPSPHPQAAIQVNERSRTMPATVTGGFNDPKSRALHGQQPAAQGVRGYQVGEHTGRRVERLIYHQPSRPPMHPHPQSDDSLAGGGQTLYPQSYHSRQASIGEVFDSYYHSPHHSHSPFAQGYANPVKTPLEEEMPNFDSQPSAGPGHTQGMTIDDHLDTHRVAPTLPSVPANALSFRSAEGFSRSKSSPNLQRQGTQEAQQYSDGFNFELPGSVPAMYSAGPQSRRNDYPSEVYGNPTSHSGNRNRQQPAPVDQTRVSAKEPNRAGTGGPSGSLPQSRSPDVRNPPPHSRPFSPNEQQSRKARNGPSPVNRIGLASPPVGQPSHPDSLPAHPVPVRAGLMASTPSNQPTRPPPVRQYSGGSGPLSGSPSSLNPHISRLPQEDSKLKAVTHQELEQLRHKTRNNSSDTRAQLLLAKKLVEAASVLADEGGRADSKTASRNRERFTSEAYKTVKKLAQSGDPDAMFYLGDCYSRGSLGLQTEPKEAFANYQAAAKAGHAQAAYRVAVCCEMGLDDGGGTKRDAVKAMQWYQRAATLGNTPAMYKLGVIRLKGLLGQPRDSKEALTWLQRAAEQADEENPHALHELALLYEAPNATEGFAQDEARAKQLFMAAANLGYKFSQFRLGCAHEYGLLGCPVDPRQSIAWYSKAAVQDEHQSELALSGWYLTGSEGVLQQSDTEAYLWARKAAQAGLAKAEYAMGYFTEVGIGAPANIEDAKRWYWRSASQNFPKARERLEDLRRGGAKMQKTRVSRSKMNKQSDGECVLM